METLKKNVLIPISFNFQIRFIIRTGLLNRLSKFCTPVILLFWNQEDLIDELKSLGFECFFAYIQPPDSKYKFLKDKVDFYYHKAILNSPTLKFRNGMKWKRMTLKKKIKHIINTFQEGRLFYDEKSFRVDISQLEDHVKQSDNFHQLNSLLDQHDIHAILTTAPFLYSEELICRVATHRNIPIFYSVLSFDNLTTRGYLPFTANHYFVWNAYNKNELLRIQPPLNHDQISITGPAQFDFYYWYQYLKNEQEWRSDKKIPEGRPVILYGANAKYFVPNEYLIVKSIDEAITNGEIQENPLVLLRPHPTDSFSDWENFVKTCKNVYIEKPLEKNQSEDKMHNKFSNFTMEDVKNLCSSLAHSAVHISYASTLALDGACFNKPLICPYFAPDNSVYNDKEIRNLYHSEHYTPIRLSGAVDLPENEVELIESINWALLIPDLRSQERAMLVDQMITFRDGRATERIAAELEKLILKLK